MKFTMTPMLAMLALATTTPALHAAGPQAAGTAAPATTSGDVVDIALKYDNSMGAFFFQPAGVYVRVGQTVRWSSGHYQHSVTAYHPASGRELRIPEHAQPFDETMGDAIRDYRETFEYTFTEPGTYDYYCRNHEARGEVGRIVVGAPGGPAAKPPGYAGAPVRPLGYDGLSSALLLPRVRGVFDALDPKLIVERKSLPFPAELAPSGTAWHPMNQPVMILAPAK